jgi:hypothetical protein
MTTAVETGTLKSDRGCQGERPFLSWAEFLFRKGSEGTYKYFATAYGKEVIAAGLTVRNLVLIPTLA